MNLDILPSEMLRGCLVCVICNSDSIHSFLFKPCIMIVHTLKMCTYNFVHILHFFKKFFMVLNLDIFFLFKMLRWCLVCVICNSNSFHSLIFKLCIVIVYTLNKSTLLFCAQLIDIFYVFRAVELRHFFHSNVCVTCNSCSFHSFLFYHKQ